MGPRLAGAFARVHCHLGHALDWWGWPAGAVQAYRDALAAEPSCTEAHLGLGEALSRRGLWPEASLAFRDAARLRPCCAEIQGNLVLALGRARRWDLAILALDRLIHLRPCEAELHVLRGALLVRLRRGHEAIRAFRWAVRLAPAPLWQRSFLGEALLGARAWNDAVRAHRWAMDVAISGAVPGGLASTWSSALNRPPAPAPDDVLSAGPREARPSLLRTPVSLSAGLVALLKETGEAGRAFARVSRAALGWSSFVLGRPLLRGERSADGAAWSLRQTRRLALGVRAVAGSLALVLSLLAPGAFAAGRAESLEALEQAHRCIEEAKEKAADACTQALALGLSRQRAYWIRRVLAGKLESLERWDDAVAVVRDLVKSEPADPDARLHLGSLLLYAQDRPEEAVAELREAARLKPEDARAHGELGVALNALGRFPESVAELEEALRLDASYLDGRPTAGLVLEASRQGERWP